MMLPYWYFCLQLLFVATIASSRGGNLSKVVIISDGYKVDHIWVQYINSNHYTGWSLRKNTRELLIDITKTDHIILSSGPYKCQIDASGWKVQREEDGSVVELCCKDWKLPIEASKPKGKKCPCDCTLF